MDKRGQELSVGTLILIVLGIVLLVLLILGFSLGWSNLWEKINIFSSSTSLESVVQKCSLAVTSNSLVSYCESFSQVTIDGKKQYVNCEYGKLRLDKTLSCGADTFEKHNTDKCTEILKAQYKSVDECKKTEIVVNDKPCNPLCGGITFTS